MPTSATAAADHTAQQQACACGGVAYATQAAHQWLRLTAAGDGGSGEGSEGGPDPTRA